MRGRPGLILVSQRTTRRIWTRTANQRRSTTRRTDNSSLVRKRARAIARQTFATRCARTIPPAQHPGAARPSKSASYAKRPPRLQCCECRTRKGHEQERETRARQKSKGDHAPQPVGRLRISRLLQTPGSAQCVTQRMQNHRSQPHTMPVESAPPQERTAHEFFREARNRGSALD
ncbi:MAG: hypothetical protein ACI9DC_001144 [Gammaproteobacteria bacterium]|jgi:hypothetical protein